MHGHAIDDVMRNVAAGCSRRGLAGMAAGALALLGVTGLCSPGIDAAGAKKPTKKKCKAGTRRCGKKCVNTRTSAAHCGGCGRACGDGEVCNGGSCSSPCQQGSEELCNGVCVNIKNDPDNCGGCGETCASLGRCWNGVCTFCDTGFRPCGARCIPDDQGQGIYCCADFECRSPDPCKTPRCRNHRCRIEDLPDDTPCPGGICCSGECVVAEGEDAHCGG